MKDSSKYKILAFACINFLALISLSTGFLLGPARTEGNVAFWIFKGISVATSSGKIQFLGISNRNEVYNTISQLLGDRQKGKIATASVAQVSQSAADELKKFKELLDNGTITLEEFEAKKKQILGL